jgi:putative serine protease PepD
MSENPEPRFPGGRPDEPDTTAAQPPVGGHGSEWSRPLVNPPGSQPPAYSPGQAPVTPPPAASFDPALGWRSSSPPPSPGQPPQAPPGPQLYGMQPPPHGAPPGTPPMGPPTVHYGQPLANGPGQPNWVKRGVVAGVAALALALTAGGVGGFVGYALHPDGSPLQVPAASNGNNAAPVVDRSSLSSIAAALQPAIVDVKTSAGEGSGVVISADGNIVTNNHVVEGARNNAVTVTFNSGKQVPATIVGTDPKTDLAVLKVDATGLSFAKWANSDDVRVGDTVLAIGSPLGLQGSVTAGIVSALHRTITVGGDQQSQFDTGSQTTIGDAIQTDAPINPGNSGGALVNTNGEVVGINSAIATQGSNGNIGVGFAISANKAKSVTDQLAKGAKVSHPYIGVSIANSDTGGAKIQQVVANGPAAKAGLQNGDVVTKVGDRPITGSEDLIGAIQGSQVGAKLQLTIQRGGATETVTVTVGEQ